MSRAFHCILLHGQLLPIAVAVAGCSTPDTPWDEPTNPVTITPVFVVASFDDSPVASSGLSNIGPGFGEALRTRLSQRSDLQVRSNPALSADLLPLITNPSNQRFDRWDAIRSRYPGVRYVVTGQVTDLVHVAPRPEDLAAQSSSRNRVQALAAVRLDIINLSQCRVESSHRMEARAWAGDKPFGRTYAGVEFGSFQFRDTPLGLAVRDLLNQAADQVNLIAPLQNDKPIRIIDRLTTRRIRLASSSAYRLAAGELLFVCQYMPDGIQLQIVSDPVIGAPLKARVESGGSSPTAWLLGQPPASLDIRQAVLTRTKP